MAELSTLHIWRNWNLVTEVWVLKFIIIIIVVVVVFVIIIIIIIIIHGLSGGGREFVLSYNFLLYEKFVLGKLTKFRFEIYV
jgi:hypothetical protein